MNYEDLTIPRGATYIASIIEAASDGVHAVISMFKSNPVALENATTRDEVRRYAVSIQSTDPSFACELLAMCDKAEQDGE